MNVKLKGKQTPENWHIMANKHGNNYFVHWQHVKNEKPDKWEYLPKEDFNNKYEELCIV